MAASPSQTCAQLVPTPNDAVPGRAPQALHTALLPRISGKSVVTIGDASTDALACLSHAAFSATAATLEGPASSDECNHLLSRKERDKMQGHAFNVHCGAFLANGSVPDADLYLFSQAAWRPHHWKIWARKGVSLGTCRARFGNCDGVEASNGGKMRSARLHHVDSFDIVRDDPRASQHHECPLKPSASLQFEPTASLPLPRV